MQASDVAEVDELTDSQIMTTVLAILDLGCWLNLDTDIWSVKQTQTVQFYSYSTFYTGHCLKAA